MRDHADGAVASPDGSRIAFLFPNYREIWVIGPGGGQARRLALAEPGYSFGRLAWSPDGRRITCVRRSHDDTEYVIEAIEVASGLRTVILSDPRLRAFCWARDGRIIYARLEAPPGETSSNLWEIRTDPRTARARGQPRRITNWGGFLFSYLDISADGRRVAFVRFRWQSDIFLGELERNRTRIGRPRRLTFDERIDWPGGWTRDSRALLFYSDRNGDLDIFRQQVSGRDAQTLAPSPEEKRDPRLSPDGAWILYLAWPNAGERSGQGRLMRLPVSGGPPQTVFPVRGYPGSARLAPDSWGTLHATGHPRFRCASVPGAPCVLAEQDRDQLVFTAFDPIEGRKGEITRIESHPSQVSFWDLSPDGRWIALGMREEQSASLRILSLEGRAAREIPVKGWTRLESVAWAADGSALFLTGLASNGSPLLRAGLNGQTHLLYTAPFQIENPSPSPDGRYLAFGEVAPDSNAWVIENFR